MPLDHLWIQDICLVKPIQGYKSVGKDAPSGSLPDEQLEAECREVLHVSYLIPGMILV